VTPIARDIYTIDRTTIKGAELEVSYEPVSNLMLTASFGSSDSSIDEFRGTDAFDGNQSPNSYKDTSSASVQWTPPLGNEVSGLFYLDWERRGAIRFDVQNLHGDVAHETLNARVGVKYADKYQLSGYVRNLTDERFPVLFQADAAGVGVHGQLLNMPRTYGVEVKAMF
jgi:outer membrane receptor protein involved in Fe transport